jgi:hypothetical protein
MGYFAELFVFNGLTPFSFRRTRNAIPAAGNGKPALPLILKNSSRRTPLRQEKVDCLAGAPSLDRRAFAAVGNRPNDPFRRIPYV